MGAKLSQLKPGSHPIKFSSNIWHIEKLSAFRPAHTPGGLHGLESTSLVKYGLVRR